MNKVKRIALLIALLPVLYLTSCHKIGSNATWDTQILAPLIKTNLSINNLVTNGSLITNPDSSLTLVFSDSLYNLNTDSLFKIPDTSLVYNYPILGPETITPGETILTNTNTNQYNVGSGVQMKKAIIQSGYLKVVINSNLAGLTDYIYQIPSLTLGGKPFDDTIPIPAGSPSTPSTITKYIPLNGYSVDFTGPTHNNCNELTTELTIALDPKASTVVTPASGGGSINVNVTFDSLVPYFGGGYFGKNTKVIGPDTSAFPLFNKLVAGKLNLKYVSVNFTLVNGFGVDAQILLKHLTSISRNGSTLNLADAAIINNPINVNRAVETYDPAYPVNASIKTFSITPTTSPNILAWIDSLPTKVAYDLQIETDPLGNVSGFTDFAYLNYGIKAYLDVNVPLSLIATNLTLEDTVSVNLATSAQAQQIKSGTFTLYADNGFPFSAGMQVYVLNSNNQVSDSLVVPTQSILAGVTNALGTVIAPTNSTVTIPVGADKMPRLLAAKKLIIEAKFNTNPSVYSKIYSYYKLNIKMVGNFDYQVKG